MSLETYFIQQFQHDAVNLKTEHINSLLLRRPGKLLLDHEARYFGGKDWKNCREDLALVQEKAAFASCVFAVLCTDLNMQISFPEEYLTFRSTIFFPYFGWQDFAPCYESPEKILSVPISLNLISLEELNVDELAETWSRFLKRYFNSFIIYISYADFIESMLKKSIFNEPHFVLGDFLIQLKMKLIELKGEIE